MTFWADQKCQDQLFHKQQGHFLTDMVKVGTNKVGLSSILSLFTFSPTSPCLFFSHSGCSLILIVYLSHLTVTLSLPFPEFTARLVIFLMVDDFPEGKFQLSFEEILYQISLVQRGCFTNLYQLIQHRQYRKNHQCFAVGQSFTFVHLCGAFYVLSKFFNPLHRRRRHSATPTSC